MLHKLGKPFKVGFLINVHRFPLNDANKMELFMGLNLTQCSLLDMHMWPFIDEVAIMKQKRPGQFSTSRQATIVRDSHYCLIKCTSDNPHGALLLKAMTKGCIKREPSPFTVHWGQHRMDQQIISKMNQRDLSKKDHRIGTWDYHHCPFPTMVLGGLYQSQILEAHMADLVSERRISMDIVLSNGGRTSNEIKELISTWKLPEQLKDTTSVFIEPVSRQSYSHWSHDKIQAWDITIKGANAKSIHNKVMHIQIISVCCMM
jgi:hypothetical protein